MEEEEATHEYCIHRAARTLASMYTTELTEEMAQRTLGVVDRWITLAQEIRAKEHGDARLFEAVRDKLQAEGM